MKVPSPQLRWHERIYLFEVFRGMVVTMRHLLENLVGQSRMPTVQYPEEPKALPVRLKGRHRLMVREDGAPKCVACYMCAQACPARCIHIVAEESPEPQIEKRPAIFDIDMLRCVFCGYCVEACPEDAIRMDTGEISIVSPHREDFIFHKEFLLYEDRAGIGTAGAEKKLDPEDLTAPPDTPEEPIGHELPGKKPAIPASW
jgi:NADH-quinone oxidoreductase subunit I